jgi:hypothetical protein
MFPYSFNFGFVLLFSASRDDLYEAAIYRGKFEIIDLHFQLETGRSNVTNWEFAI